MIVAAIAATVGMGGRARGAIHFGVLGDSYSTMYLNAARGGSSRAWSDMIGYGYGYHTFLTEDQVSGHGIYHAVSGYPASTSSSISRYNLNWAFGGATTSRALNIQLHGNNSLSDTSYHNLAEQITAGKVDLAVVAIGINDLTNLDPGAAVSSAVANIETIINGNPGGTIQGIRQLDPNLPIVLANIPDASAAPNAFYDSTPPTAAENQAIHQATLNANQQIDEFAARLGIPVVDWFGISRLGASDLTIGNYTLTPTTDPDNPTNSDPTQYFWADGVHPTSIPQGLFANTLLEAFNQKYGGTLNLLTGDEIYRGLGDISNFDYGRYVLIPNPSSAVLLLAGALVLAGMRRPRRRLL